MVSACVSAARVEERVAVRRPSPVPPQFSLLELGRRLSGGGVDIFDPWAPTFQIPALSKKLPGIAFKIPRHDSMIWRDPGVEVYSLAGFAWPLDEGDVRAIEEAQIGLTPPTSLTGSEPDGVIEKEPLLP